MAKQYEMTELIVEPGNASDELRRADAAVIFTEPGTGKEVQVKGFDGAEGKRIFRFLPLKSGIYEYRGENGLGHLQGLLEVKPADESHHGPVRADGTMLVYDDGCRFASFGTTVYSMLHQSDELFSETIRTLAGSPFNKVRLCLFPKHHPYCVTTPPYFPFEPRAGKQAKTFLPQDAPDPFEKPDASDDYWDVDRPNSEFWDMIDERLSVLMGLGIQADLILFHPYDRWGLSNLSMDDNLKYLDYAIRRLAAYPDIWWSLSNEYDLTLSKSTEDWRQLETYIAENDPYHHMLGCHNWIAMWAVEGSNSTHSSLQTKQLWRVAELMKKTGKPVMIDECRYEGDLPDDWGNLSGQEMTRCFWQVTVQGGYCTHGETYLPEKNKEAIWWAHGGRLRGESVQRIAYLKEIIDSLPGPIEFMADSGLNGAMDFTGMETQEDLDKMSPIMRQAWDSFHMMPDIERQLFLSKNIAYNGHCGDDAFLYYLDDQCCSSTVINLPEDREYTVDVIDTWNMERKTACKGARGDVRVDLPGRPYMAILAQSDSATLYRSR